MATERMAAGTIVRGFSGLPYASCLLPALHARRCDHCYKEAEAKGALLRACATCGFVHYCSEACRKAEAALHVHECATLSRLRVRIQTRAEYRIEALALGCPLAWCARMCARIRGHTAMDVPVGMRMEMDMGRPMDASVAYASEGVRWLSLRSFERLVDTTDLTQSGSRTACAAGPIAAQRCGSDCGVLIGGAAGRGRE